VAYQYWLDELSLLASNTQRNYKHYFDIYIKYAEVSAEELYRWQKRLLDDGDPRTNREVARSVAQCIAEMVDEGYSSGTSVIVASAVRSFMTANGLTFPLTPKDLPKVNNEGSRVALLDEIKQLWDVVGNELKERNRALLMVLKDTGLRVSDIVQLTCDQYYNSKKIETEQGTFRIFRFITKKTSEPAYIHLGPESCESLDLYLGDRITGPLFLNRSNKPMTNVALTMLIGRTASRIDGMKKLSAHSFRKTHRTLLEARMPESYVKKLQGKSTDTYIRPEETGELTRSYIENYDVLRVFKEDQELEQVKQELNQYKTESDMVRLSQLGRVSDLENKVSRLEQVLMVALNNSEALAETKRRLTS
jgi:integrase